MTEYSPDAWVILRLQYEEEVIHKVLAGWYGGYLGTNSWRMNSGISCIDRDGDWYLIRGYSGSLYRVHKDNQRMNMLMATVHADIVDKLGEENVRVVDIDDLVD